MFQEILMRPRAIKPGMWIESKAGIAFQVTDCYPSRSFFGRTEYVIHVDGSLPFRAPATTRRKHLAYVKVLVEI